MSPAKEPFYLAHYSVIPSPWRKNSPDQEFEEEWEPLYSDTDSMLDAEHEALLTDNDGEGEDDKEYDSDDNYYNDDEDHGYDDGEDDDEDDDYEDDSDESDTTDSKSIAEDETCFLTDDFDVEVITLSDDEASLLDKFHHNLRSDNGDMGSIVLPERRSLSDTSTRSEPPMGSFRYSRLRAASLGAIKFSKTHPDCVEDWEVSSVD